MDKEPKTPKGNRSRLAIKAAAREVFRADGYARAKVTDIAATAGFSNGAFYKYFKDKHAVMLELLHDLLSDAFEFVREPWSGEDPEASVRITTMRYLEFYQANRDLFRILVEVTQTDPDVESMWAEIRSDTISRVERMITRSRSLGFIRESVDGHLAAILLVVMTDHFAYLWFVLERASPRSIESVAEEITQIWTRGVYSTDIEASPLT